MKCKGLVLCLILCTALPLSAQSRIRLGAKAGYNFSLNYGVPDERYEVSLHGRHGAGGGLSLYLPITSSFGLQYELLYVMKGSRTGVKVVDEPIQVDVRYTFDYLEMPAVFKLHIREFGRFGLFTATGFALSILIQKHYQLDGTVGFNDGGTWRVEPIAEESDMPNTDIFDFSFVFGGGITYRLRSKRLFLEYRFTIGWNSIPVPTYETEDPVGMRNQAYSLMLGIEL